MICDLFLIIFFTLFPNNLKTKLKVSCLKTKQTGCFRWWFADAIEFVRFFCVRLSTASSWRESRMWGSRRPTSPSWRDTWQNCTRWRTPRTHWSRNSRNSLQVIYGVKDNICKSLNCEACFTLLILFNLLIFQNCTLMCRSRELEGDGGSDEEERESPSCSLISFAEFNHGAVKNKVSVRTITKTARPLFFKWSVSVDI